VILLIDVSMRPCHKIYLAHPSWPTYRARKICLICMSATCFRYCTFNYKSVFRVRVKVSVTVRVSFRVI